MKRIINLTIWLVFLAWSIGLGQQKVRATLVPEGDKVYSLGNSANSWKALYADTAKMSPVVTVASSTSLNRTKANYICAGTNDDAIIQTAISLVAGKGTVQLLDGTFLINDSLNIPAGVTLRGLGKDVTIIKADASFNKSMVYCEDGINIKIYDLTLDGNNANQAYASCSVYSAGIKLTHVDNVILENVRIRNTATQGVLVFNPGNTWNGIAIDTNKNVYIERCIFDTIGTGNLFRGVFNLTIKDCQFNGWGVNDQSKDAIALWDTIIGVTIQNNHFYRGNAEYFAIENVCLAENVNIVGNFMYTSYCGISGWWNNTNIKDNVFLKGEGSDRSGIEFLGGSHSRITNNTLHNGNIQVSSGLNSDGYPYPVFTEDVKIEENKIFYDFTKTTWAILVGRGNGTESQYLLNNIEVNKNFVYAPDSLYWNIILANYGSNPSRMTNIRLYDNTVYGTKDYNAGIYLRGLASGTNNIVIDRNTVLNCPYGYVDYLCEDSLDNITITNNDFSRCSTPFTTSMTSGITKKWGNIIDSTSKAFVTDSLYANNGATISGNLKVTGNIGLTNNTLSDAATYASFSAGLTAGTFISAGTYITLAGDLKARANLTLLDKPETGWLAFATRNTAGADAVYDLTNVGSIGASGNVTGTWTGNSISTTYTDAKCTATWPNTYTANQNLNTNSAVTFGGITSNLASATQGLFYGWSATGGGRADCGQVTLGNTAAYCGTFDYNATGNTILYINNTYNDNAAAIYFRTKTSGTPVNVLTLNATTAAFPGTVTGTYFDASDNTFGGAYIDDTHPDTIVVALAQYYTIGAKQGANGYKLTSGGVLQNVTVQDSSLTIQKTGKYLITYNMSVSSVNMPSGSRINSYIYVNDTKSEKSGALRWYSGTNDYGELVGRGIYSITANDIIKVRVASLDDTSGSLVVWYFNVDIVRID